MYIPEAFRIEYLSRLHDFIEEYSFMTLVSVIDQCPFATHLPMLLDRSRGEFGTIVGHVARSNPHWRSLAGVAGSLAICHGPNAYISPGWYGENVIAVPTWNYAAVHCYGTASVISDERWLHDLLERLAAKHEAGIVHSHPVHVPAAQHRTLVQAIVGIEMPIERLEGKFKLSQNRPLDQQAGVLCGLTAQGCTSMVEFMETQRQDTE